MDIIKGFFENLQPILQSFLETYGYSVVALVIFLENAGLPVPGETTLILASALSAKNAALSFPLVLLAAVTGAILGDNMGYFLGRRYGRGLILTYGKFLGLTAPKFEKAEKSFLKNSAAAVFVGRFIFLLRVLAGPLAGITEMPWPKFFLFNSLGAITWASIIGTTAYFFGEKMGEVFKDLGIWAAVILIGAIVIFSLGREFWEERKLKRELEADKKNELPKK